MVVCGCGTDILLRPKEAAAHLGITVTTLQRWDRQGRIRVVRTQGNMRRIPTSEVHRLTGEQEHRLPILYARVSSHGQKDDLERQKERLQRAFPGAEMYTDIRSGLKFDRPGFLTVLKAVQERRVSGVVVAYEDRLARFGVDLFRFGVDLLRQVFAAYGTTLEVLDPKPKETSESELANDLFAIITSFSARLYGLRSHKTKRLLAEARKVVKGP
ncbi:MAG: IS607 family transposase [Thermoplasmata archaeon]